MRSIILNRIIYIPFGLLKGLVTIANNYARDIQNKKRFPSAIINEGCKISNDTLIGEKVSLTGPSYFNHCIIGNYTYISRGALFEHVKIGNYCSVAHDVMAGLGAHPLDRFSTSPLFYTKKNPFKLEIVNTELDFNKFEEITIGNDVWIGARVTIMNGVKIGDGAIIAAGSVITKDVEPFTVVGGVPAKLIRCRNINNFQSAVHNHWWNLEPHIVQRLYNDL